MPAAKNIEPIQPLTKLLSTPGGGFYRLVEDGAVPLLALNASETGIALGGLSEATVYRLIAMGTLHAVRNIRHVTVAIEEIQRFLREETTTQDDR